MKYHRNNPVKISIIEKVELVDRVGDMVMEILKTVGDSVRVIHTTIFPRFFHVCCKLHMTDEKVWLLD